MNLDKSQNHTMFCDGLWDYISQVTNLPIFLTAVYSFQSISTTFKSTLTLVALRRDKILYPASNLLLCNLSLIDLGAGFISHPLSIAFYRTATSQSSWEYCEMLKYSALLPAAIFSGIFVDANGHFRIDFWLCS